MLQQLPLSSVLVLSGHIVADVECALGISLSEIRSFSDLTSLLVLSTRFQVLKLVVDAGLNFKRSLVLVFGYLRNDVVKLSLLSGL